MAGGYTMGNAGMGGGRGENYELQQDILPPGPGQKAEQKANLGVAFSTDFSGVGHGDSMESKIFNSSMHGGSSVVDEERRLIDKVFNIVDKDRSNSIEMQELQDMFKIFGQDSDFLTGALKRIMDNVEKARAAGEPMGESTGSPDSISPTEFYYILSKKFNPGDPKRDIENVFHKMDKNRDGLLDYQEIFDLSQQLGEDADRNEIKDMVALFSRSYQKELLDLDLARAKTKDAKPPEPPMALSFDDFFEVMQVSLADKDSLVFSGGYAERDEIWYTGPQMLTPAGESLNFGMKGFVNGRAQGTTTGMGVEVMFDSHTAPVNCLVTYLNDAPPEGRPSDKQVEQFGSGEYKTNNGGARAGGRAAGY